METTESNPETAPPAAPPPAAPEASPNGMLYFKKVLYNMGFFIDRKPVPFEPLDRNLGVLKISAADRLAPYLTAAAKAKKGGIVAIDEATYADLKKKLPFRLLAPKSPRLAPLSVRAEPHDPKSLRPSGAAAAANRIFRRAGVGSVGGGGAGNGAGTPVPVSAPSPAPPGEFRPATGKKIKMPVLRRASGNSLVSRIAQAAELAAAGGS